MKKNNRWIAYSTWSFVTLFLFYQYFLRIFPTVMVSNLMEAFSVTASHLGVLSAFFFYAYAPMQIPVGLLLDHFGPRRLLTFASFACGVGSLFFGMAGSLAIAKFGRFFMGIGAASAFVGMVYICSHMFPIKKRALLIGIANSIGLLGAVGATGPLSYFVDLFGWRFIVNAFGFIGLALSVVLYCFIRRENGSHRATITELSLSSLKNLKIVCLNHQIWLNGIIALLTHMTTSVFAALWGIPFLMTSYAISKELAGFIVSMIFVGWIIGGPIIGMISDRFKRRKPLLCFSLILTIILLIPVLYIPHLPIASLFVLFLLIGFFQSGELLNFSLSVELIPMRSKGMGIAFTNFIIACGSSMIQPLIGVFLDLGWNGPLQNEVRIYSLYNYHIAMLTFPITLFLALVLLLFLKEGKKHVEMHNEMIGMD